MKKLLLEKVLAAVFVFAVSSYFVELHAQVAVTFQNETGARQEGIAGSNNGAVTLNFTIDGTGNVSLDASTPSEVPGHIELVDSWDNANAGTTDIATLFGTSFSLEIKTNGKRLDNRNDFGGAFGIQGSNSGRIDDLGKEILYFILGGNVGLKIDSLGINNVGGDVPNFMISDYDTDSLYYLTPSVLTLDSTLTLGDDVMSMRYASDSLSIYTSDTIPGSGGGSVSAIYFSLVEPVPGVVATSPLDGDTLVNVATDYVISFNTPMNTSTTEAAIAFTPDVVNRVNTWNGAGDELTISFDALPNYTMFSVVVGANMQSASGANSDRDFVFSFQTLPVPPTVEYIYPENSAKDVLVNTPMIIEFSRSMLTDSVEKALSFDPEVSDLIFNWNGAHTKVFVTTSDLGYAKNYIGTISTVATDIYGLQLMEPYVFSFTTANMVSVPHKEVDEVILYPNPASDILYIRGMAVASLQIYSMTGQLIKSQLSSNEVSVSGIMPGSYIITASDRNQNSIRKLIVIE